MVLTTKSHAELSPVFVALSKQATLGVYGTRNRLFTFNMKCDGTIGKFPSIPTAPRSWNAGVKSSGLVLTTHHRPMSHLALSICM